MKNIVARTINKAVLAWGRGYLKDIEKSRTRAPEMQQHIFHRLMECGKQTAFGKEHDFNNIYSLSDFQNRVGISKYDDIAPYIARIRQGEDYVLWNQKVKWFAKSSGTSSDKSKFIPITPDSLYETHFKGMKMMLMNYAALNPDTHIFSTCALTLGGSVTPTVTEHSSGFPKIFEGDLSAVMLNNSPATVELLRTPSKKTSLIADFATKVELICKESTRKNVSNFSGVPSWNLVLMNKILEYTGKNNIMEVWPKMELFMHGGISFEPYREIYRKLFPSANMHYLENYNASEGYFAFQDSFEGGNGMLITANNGIFYEFIPFSKLNEALQGDNSYIVPLEGVKTDIDYAIVISTVGGLWRYMPEDLVRFTSTTPYKLLVVGRTKMFINAFGEELMINNAEKALAAAAAKINLNITDFTAAPCFMSIGDKKSEQDSTLTRGYHLWAIEFDNPLYNPHSHLFSQRAVDEFAEILDMEIQKVNSDYEAKRSPNSTMQRLKIEPLAPGTFYKWMVSRGKVGGQNKVPRLWKDTKYIDQLTNINRLSKEKAL